MWCRFKASTAWGLGRRSRRMPLISLHMVPSEFTSPFSYTIGAVASLLPCSLPSPVVNSADPLLRSQLPHRPQLPWHQRRTSDEIVRPTCVPYRQPTSIYFSETLLQELTIIYQQWHHCRLVQCRWRHLRSTVLLRGPQGSHRHHAGTSSSRRKEQEL